MQGFSFVFVQKPGDEVNNIADKTSKSMVY